VGFDRIVEESLREPLERSLQLNRNKFFLSIEDCDVYPRAVGGSVFGNGLEAELFRKLNDLTG
jgi:hypothetical protein